MDGAVTGYLGKFTYGVGNTELGGIVNATFEETVGTHKTTTNSDKTGKKHTYEPGKYGDTTIKCSLLLKEGGTYPAIGDKLTNVKLYADDTSTDDIYWTGAAIVTRKGNNIEMVDDSTVSLDYDLQGTGAWSYADNTGA